MHVKHVGRCRGINCDTCIKYYPCADTHDESFPPNLYPTDHKYKYVPSGDRRYKRADIKTTIRDFFSTSRSNIGFTPDSQHIQFIDLKPKSAALVQNKQLESDMVTVRKITEAIFAARDKEKLGLKIFLPKVIVTGSSDVYCSLYYLSDIVKEMANVREIEYVGKRWSKCQVILKLNRPIIGRTFKKDVSVISETLSKLGVDDIQFSSQNTYNLTVGDKTFGITPDMISFDQVSPPGYVSYPFDNGTIYFDPTITDEMRNESYIREIVRFIQVMRSDNKLDKKSKISLTIQRTDLVSKLLLNNQKNIDIIKKRVNAAVCNLTLPEINEKIISKLDLDGNQITIGITELR